MMWNAPLTVLCEGSYQISNQFCDGMGDGVDFWMCRTCRCPIAQNEPAYGPTRIGEMAKHYRPMNSDELNHLVLEVTLAD